VGISRFCLVWLTSGRPVIPGAEINWFLDASKRALSSQRFCGSQRVLLKDDFVMGAVQPLRPASGAPLPCHYRGSRGAVPWLLLCRSVCVAAVDCWRVARAARSCRCCCWPALPCRSVCARWCRCRSGALLVLPSDGAERCPLWRSPPPASLTLGSCPQRTTRPLPAESSGPTASGGDHPGAPSVDVGKICNEIKRSRDAPLHRRFIAASM
jgi:hypothetical protein